MRKKLLFIIAMLGMPFMLKASFVPTCLRVSGLEAPLGIDTEHPTFSWQTRSDGRGFVQSAYEITVSTAGGEIVWETGKVTSRKQNQIVYAGKPLASRTAYIWQLTVYGSDGSASEPVHGTFETAFMKPADWQAEWICAPKGVNSSVEIAMPDGGTDARYVKIDVTKLGMPASTDPNFFFMQLAEVEIYSGGENIARNATFTSNDSWTIGAWDIKYVNDGEIGGTHLGYTSQQHSSAAAHIYLTADLKETQHIDRIVLYPRQDDCAKGGTEAANFPASYTVQVSDDNSTYKELYSATDAAAPAFANAANVVPYIGRAFTVADGKTVNRARLYASATGVFTIDINGKAVTDNVLEPGEAEFEKTILYTVYDVTDKLRTGGNTIIARIAGGLFNVDALPGRYSKGEIKNSGPKCVKAELHIDYADGSHEVVMTDGDWLTCPSPTLGSNWWGGEDFDARRRIAGIGSPDFNFSGWAGVTVEKAPVFRSSQATGMGTLRSRMYEPVKVVETWKAADVKSVYSGGYHLYVVDFGKNFAGTYRFRLKGKSGQTITLREGESLNADGSVFMQNYYTGPADTYDTYTFAGDADGETWGPEFMYHGFRYLQIIGLDEAPSPADFTAMRQRSAMKETGRMETGNSLINDIHRICRDAIQSQLYNSVTDCPQREKLGWLDVSNEMYNSLCFNYDMETFWHKVVLDCFDAQYADGHVPSTVPHFMSVYDNDPNWGGAAILVPYRSWKWYGDRTTIAERYDGMKRLIDYYTSVTSDGIMPGNSFSVLSDWGQETAGVSPMVPGEFTITTTYYYMLRVMEEVATELGKHTDAAAFARQAEHTKASFNKRYYTNGIYAGGRQSEQAMPLYYGLVDSGNEDLVAKNLAERVRKDNYKIRTGEIALKPLLMSLAKYGYNDIVYKMANQTDCPSYGFWVEQGYTTTPEYWDVGAFSQNHCMMDHIEEWFFSELGGIKNAGLAFDTISIAPWIPEDMGCMDISVESTYGTIRSAYVKGDGGRYEYMFTVPENSVARVTVPLGSDNAVTENGKPLEAGSNGVVEISYSGKTAVILLGSGRYTLTTGRTGGENGIAQLSLDDGEEAPVFYTMNGVRVEHPSDGIYIRSTSRSNEKTLIRGK